MFLVLLTTAFAAELTIEACVGSTCNGQCVDVPMDDEDGMDDMQAQLNDLDCDEALTLLHLGGAAMIGLGADYEWGDCFVPTMPVTRRQDVEMGMKINCSYSSGLSTGALIGIIIAAVVVLALIGVGLMMCSKKKDTAQVEQA